jgi:hypothetical protein
VKSALAVPSGLISPLHLSRLSTVNLLQRQAILGKANPARNEPSQNRLISTEHYASNLVNQEIHNPRFKRRLDYSLHELPKAKLFLKK